MDVSQYLEIFIDETKEHLQSLNEQLLILEKEPDNADTINEIFRAAHSLKGMAGTMGYKRMQKLTHDMENVFSEIRNGKMKVNASMVDILFQCLDALEGYLDVIVNTQDEGTNDNQPIINELNDILNGTSTKSEAPAKEAEEVVETTQKASSDKFVAKYKDIELADHEKHAIAEAFEKGLNVYGITVYVQESCILKAARVFLVFKGIEAIGETIKSVPSVQDIEDEKFDYDFSMYVISAEPYEKVEAVIKNVSEIETCVGEKLDQSCLVAKKSDKEESKVVKDETKNETAKPAATQAAAKAATQTATKTAGKPVVNRTVRVDI